MASIVSRQATETTLRSLLKLPESIGAGWRGLGVNLFQPNSESGEKWREAGGGLRWFGQ